MPITISSSAELKKSPTQTKRAANNGPVIITEYGRPVYVILNFETYVNLAGESTFLIDRFGTLKQTAANEDQP
jgi:PHD/YefM family antitoxin component YafN of YafNO toxin-antitoxin module